MSSGKQLHRQVKLVSRRLMAKLYSTRIENVELFIGDGVEIYREKKPWFIKCQKSRFV